ncbi:12413_t:CDS:2, partial [Entrophospora sp. SA101]
SGRKTVKRISNKILEELSTISAASTSANFILYQQERNGTIEKSGSSRSSGLGAKGKREEKKREMEK